MFVSCFYVYHSIYTYLVDDPVLPLGNVRYGKKMVARLKVIDKGEDAEGHVQLGQVVWRGERGCRAPS